MFFSNKAPKTTTVINTIENVNIGETVRVYLGEEPTTGTIVAITTNSISVKYRAEVRTFHKAPAGTMNAGTFVATGHENRVLSDTIAKFNN